MSMEYPLLSATLVDTKIKFWTIKKHFVSADLKTHSFTLKMKKLHLFESVAAQKLDSILKTSYSVKDTLVSDRSYKT